jgi:hypothetical protein
MARLINAPGFTSLRMTSTVKSSQDAAKALASIVDKFCPGIQSALHRRHCRVLELEPVPPAALTYGGPSRTRCPPSRALFRTVSPNASLLMRRADASSSK